MVDQSVFYIQQDYAGDPRQFFFGSKRPQSVGELAADLPVSRPAVSQHLRTLKEAQLVIDQAEGTKRIYRIDPRGLGLIRAWLDDHWSEALRAFQKFTDQEGI